MNIDNKLPIGFLLKQTGVKNAKDRFKYAHEADMVNEKMPT